MRKHSAIQSGVLALGIGLCLLPGLVVPGEAMAGEVDDALAKATEDIAAGRCDEAERGVASIPGLENRALLLGGQCRIGQGLYPEALDRLDRIRGASDLTREQVGDVELFRAVALYHLERYTEAAAALDSADGMTGEEAQLALYRGLLALRDGDNDRAAPALESAARLSPRLTEPVASYYAGLAWQGASERNKAREAFQRVIDLDGDGAWGKEAKKLLESTELFPYYVRGSIGMEYDDNVLLRGDVTQIVDGNPLTISGDNDWRGVWEIEGGVQLFQSDDATWSGGLTASYEGNAHVELADINLHYPTIGAYLSKRLDSQTVAQARYQFGHAWIDEDPYLQGHTAEVSLSHTWTRAGTTVLLADVIANDLRFKPDEVLDLPVGGCPALVVCSPVGVNERRERDRDGYGLGGAIEHRYLLPVPVGLEEVIREAVIGGGYRFRFYDSEGDEWEHFAHTLSAALEVSLPLEFGVATRFSYVHRDFQNPSTFPDVETAGAAYSLSNSDRNEHQVAFEGEVEKGLSDNLSVSARYSYLSNDSNRDAFDYNRHIVGGYLNFRFD